MSKSESYDVMYILGVTYHWARFLTTEIIKTIVMCKTWISKYKLLKGLNIICAACPSFKGGLVKQLLRLSMGE